MTTAFHIQSSAEGNGEFDGLPVPVGIPAGRAGDDLRFHTHWGDATVHLVTGLVVYAVVDPVGDRVCSLRCHGGVLMKLCQVPLLSWYPPSMLIPLPSLSSDFTV